MHGRFDGAGAAGPWILPRLAARHAAPISADYRVRPAILLGNSIAARATPSQ
jgi:hypothetical protein